MKLGRDTSMTQDDTTLLRKIADFGMTWKLSHPAPEIPNNNPASISGGEQIDASQVAKLVKDDLLTASIVNIDTANPHIGYVLTEKGSQRVIDSFQHLIKGVQPSKVIYDPQMTYSVEMMHELGMTKPNA